MQDENCNNHFIIVAELYVLFVVIILSFIVILNLIGILVAKEVPGQDPPSEERQEQVLSVWMGA